MICLSFTSTEERTDLYQNVLSFLARIKYKVIEQTQLLFYHANPINAFLSTFNIIREKIGSL